MAKVHLRDRDPAYRNYGICGRWAYSKDLTDEPDKVTCKNCLRILARKENK